EYNGAPVEVEMLDPALVRDHIDDVRSGLRRRGLDPAALLEEVTTLDASRRRLIPVVEGLKRDQNTSGEEIARARQQGLATDAILEANRARAQEIRQLTGELDGIEEKRSRALLTLPNLPHATVPDGANAGDNQEVRRVGEPPAFDFEPLPHWEIGAKL